MTDLPLHHPSEHRGYSPDERAVALRESLFLIGSALLLPTYEARAAALAGACRHASPLVGYGAVAFLVDAVARHGRLEWFE